MSTATVNLTELVHELEVRLEKAGSGVRDAEEMRMARESMNRSREELRQRIGTVDVAVELVRDARSQ